MFLSICAKALELLFASPLAATSDELPSWVLPAIAVVVLLALVLLVVAALKRSRDKNQDGK